MLKQNETNPLISVIIPCYNQAIFLDETINCLINQSYLHWECLIINDGSTDQTEALVKMWLTKDERFHYFSTPNGGVSQARNVGLDHAKGTYIQFLDADDVISKSKLLKSIDCFEKLKVDIVCTNYTQFLNATSNELGTFSILKNYEFTFKNIAYYWNGGFTIPIHCFMFKHQTINSLRFPVGLTAQEDWVLWLQVFAQNPQTFYLDEVHAFYRMNPTSRTNTKGFFDETLQAIRFLKGNLAEENFIMLYESVIKRFDEGQSYWRKREANLKQSNTYQFGLLCKRFAKKLKLLTLAKYCFSFVLSLKKK